MTKKPRNLHHHAAKRIAERYGSGGYYIWKCGEWEPTEEWKAEWTKGA